MQNKPKKKTGVKNGIRPENETKYVLYQAWRSLPAMFKGIGEKELKDKFGIEDPEIIELAGLKTQGDFAARFGIGIETCSRWNNKMEADGFDHLAGARRWADKLTKNVVFAHYNKLIRKFDPMSGDSWYKVISGWNEKKEVEHTGKLSILELIEQGDDDDEDSDQEDEE